jgi:hypothetical protein
VTPREVNAKRADHCCGALSTQLRFGQKIVGERRRSRFAELDGSSSADGNFFTIHTGNFALDTIIYVLYMISIELRST